MSEQYHDLWSKCCSVLEADAIAPYFMRSHFDLPRTDVDIAKAPTVSKRGFMLGIMGLLIMVWSRYKNCSFRQH